MQRSKGARGEREWAEFCREHFGLQDSRRTAQRMGAPDSNDVITWPGTHAEVKRVETLNVEKALGQAETDARGEKVLTKVPNGEGMPVPYVAHRRNRTDWIVSVRAADLLEFCERVLAHRNATENPANDPNLHWERP
jgi:hypothetical protein